jgi:hypothetical protein
MKFLASKNTNATDPAARPVASFQKRHKRGIGSGSEWGNRYRNSKELIRNCDPGSGPNPSIVSGGCKLKPDYL